MNSSSPEEALLADYQFWDLFFFVFCNEDNVREFSAVSKIPVERIKAARRDFLRLKMREFSQQPHPETVH